MKDNATKPSLDGKQINAIIFDMDGTLSDSIDAYFDVFNQAAATVGLKFEREEVLCCLANQINIWEKLFPDDLPEREQIIRKISIATKEIYTKTIQKVKLFPNLEQVLKKLKDNDIKMGVVTASSRESLTPLYNNRLEHYFEVMISWEDDYPRKPAPDSIIACLKRMNADAKKSIVVGDTLADIIAGREGGTLTVGVLSGMASRDMLEREKPTAIIDWVGDIPALLGI
ncbi:Pyrophosphatase PpaX [subsurface metagenome]